MKINRLFNQFQKETYFEVIENHQSYSDFNTLGLYRSLTENELLSTEELIEIRDFAHGFFQKTFEFLQLKDPLTYFKVTHLGQELTRGDELNAWRIIRENQQKILNDKKIKHRNFGTYSKHDCGLDYCHLNGMMVKQGSRTARNCMFFKTDENKDEKEIKIKRLQKEKRIFKQNKNRFED